MTWILNIRMGKGTAARLNFPIFILKYKRWDVEVITRFHNVMFTVAIAIVQDEAPRNWSLGGLVCEKQASDSDCDLLANLTRQVQRD